MSIRLLVGMSLRNVRRQGRKSVGTLTVMAVSVLALCLLAGYMTSTMDLVQNAFVRWGARGDLIIEQPASKLGFKMEGVGVTPLTASVQAKIDKVLADDPAVVAHARILRIAGMVSNDRVSTVFSGIGEDVAGVRKIKGPAYEYDVVAGTPLWLETQAHPLILGQGLAASLGCDVPKVGFAPVQPGESPTSRPFDCPKGPLQLTVSTLETARINAARLHPTGIMDWGIQEVNERLVVLPLADAQSLLGTESVSEYHVMLHAGADLDAVRTRLSTRLDQAGLEVSVFRWDDRAAFYQQVKSMLGGFLNFIAIVAGFVSFTSLLNASYMNFAQRSREFATLRSLGFTRRFVTTLAAMENAWLATAAALVGIAAAFAITLGVRLAAVMWTPPGSSNAVPVDIAWVVPVYVLALIGVVLIAALASTIPVRKILRKPIHVVLAEP